MEFGIIGTSIWQQNMKLLEKITIERDNKDEILKNLKEALNLDELIYLSTCNRVEIIYTINDSSHNNHILHRLIDFFFSDGSDLNFFPNDFYHFRDKEAITHLFRTVSSLESLVVGETQITGQFKDAYQDALAKGHVGFYLHTLADEALTVAKKIKRETTIGSGHQSMASLAVQEIKNHLHNQKEKTIALVGAGEMTGKFAKYITKDKLGKILFVNRSIEKAEKFAKEFNGTSVSLEDFKKAPQKVNVIASSTACKHAIFDSDFIEKLPQTDQPVLAIDLAIPRDFSDDIDTNKNIKLVDIPALKSKANGNLRKKFVEAGKANNIIRESVYKFVSNQLEVSIKPIFHSSFKESIQLAHNALDDLFKKKVTSLQDDDKNAIKNLVTKLISNASFQPSKVLSEKMAQAKTNLNFEKIHNKDKEKV